MALVACEECGSEISSKANACPKCGCPVGSEKKAVERDEMGYEVSAGGGATSKSSGGVFEFVGFAMIVLGMVGCIGSRSGEYGGSIALVSIGFVVFVAGRFMR